MMQSAKWVATCALWVALLAIGCATQREPLPTATSSTGGSALQAPQPSQPTDPPPATPSPTPTLPGTNPSPEPTPTQSPTPTMVPTATPTPIPSPTPTPTPALRQLTQGNCCTQPFWSPDSQKVLFIDKPRPDLPVGIWAISATEADPTPELVTERITTYTADLSFRIEQSQDTTTIERLETPLS
ncbi:MAG: hypothetical protein JSV81_19090, partial [Anaerolineales bacterium]